MMDKELIERWAREAGMAPDGLGYPGGDMEDLQRFAALVRADALEEAAKLADEDDHLSGTGDAIRKLIQAP